MKRSLRSISAMSSVLFASMTYFHHVEAADATATLLNAPVAKQRIYVWVARTQGEKGLILRYQLDEREGTGQTLTGEPTVATAGEVTFLFKDFNPLRYRVAGSSVESDDPNFKQLAELLSKIGDLSKLISPTPAGKALRTLGERAEKCRAFRDALTGLSDRLQEPLVYGPNKELSRAGLKDWVETATGREGLRQTAKTIREVEQGFAAALEANKRDLRTLEETALKGQTAPDCKFDVTLFDLSAMILVSDRSAGVLAQQAKIIEQLKALAAQLDAFAEGPWYGDDFEFLRKKPTVETQSTVTIEVKAVSLAATESGGPDVKTDTSAKQTLILRASRSVVWEAAAGLAYSGLKTNKYGTGAKQGDATKTVVTSAGTEPADLGAAFLANAVFRGPFGASLPMFVQFGVSLQKDVPALLVGLGFRLSAKSSTFAIAGGFAGGWPRELDRLKVGDEVSGTADIEADLKRQFHGSYYFALQYNF